MSLASCQAILGMGGFFILLGVAFILWNRKEKKRYYNSILTQKDIKEAITHEPKHPWLRAWQIGGRISLIIGIMLVIAGAILCLGLVF